ncbi:MAG: hypothetical protein UH625_06875 [Muribaculaceae bacterium]|nr:hypothetical protein [Muribaculaceae bacterium]
MIEKNKFYFYSFTILFWLTGTWGFVFQEIATPLLPATGLVRLFLDVFVIILGLMTLQKRRDIIIIVSFFALAYLSSVLLNKESLTTFLNGCREYVGIMFMFPILRYLLTCKRAEEFKTSLDRQIIIFLAIQWIAIPFQAVKYGVGDHGGGTLGDGLSGAISTILYIGTFYLVSRNWDADNYFASLRRNWKYLLLLGPSFLNETKISFIYFFFFFLFLFGFKAKSLFKLLLALPAISILFTSLGYVYLTATGQDIETLTDPEFYEAYLFGIDAENLLEIGENYQEGDYYDLEDIWAIDLPRILKISQTPMLLQDCRGGMMFGAGVGQFKGGTTMEKTDFARRNDFMLRGTIPMMYDLLVQLGILGVIWYFCAMGSAINFRNKRTPMSLNVKCYIGMIVFLQLFYGTLFTYLMVDAIFFFICLRTQSLSNDHEQVELSNTQQS